MPDNIDLSSAEYENKRLKALANYQILDTPREAAFEDIVEVLSLICEKPIAVINFIDQNQQWFKSEKGLGVRETPLDISICAHDILQPVFSSYPIPIRTRVSPIIPSLLVSLTCASMQERYWKAMMAIPWERSVYLTTSSVS